MADDAVRAPVIGKLLWRCRRLLVALGFAGAGLGALTWVVLPQSFTSNAKVLLQGATEESQVSTAAEIAMGRVVVQRAVADLGWQAQSVDEDAVSAEATQGSVITINAIASDPTKAHALAARVTQEYISFATEVAEQSANAAAEALSSRRADLQRQIAELDDSSSRRTELLQALNDLDSQVAETKTEAAVGNAGVRVIEPAEVPDTSSTPTLLVLTAGGAALAAMGGRGRAGGRPARGPTTAPTG